MEAIVITAGKREIQVRFEARVCIILAPRRSNACLSIDFDCISYVLE